MKKRKILALLALAGLLTLGGPALTASAGWVNGGTSYTTNGTKLTGLRQLKSGRDGKLHWYFFNNNGIKQTSCFQNVNGKLYYFDSNGAAPIGWFALSNGKKYLADNNGILAKDQWVGNYYFLSDGSMAVNTMINGKYVGADGKYTGVLNNVGWVTDKGKTVFYDSNHQLVRGWLNTGGKTYYMNPSTGALMHGWITVGGKKYYAGPKTGAIQKSMWKSGKYLKDNGEMAVGLTKAGKYTYFFSSTGKKRTGWIKYNKHYYYCNSKGVVLKKKWVSNKKYYVGADGTRAAGFAKVGKYTYYFKPSTGVKQKYCWVSSGGNRYWLSSSGVVQKNRWLWSKKYYASKSGAVLKGFNAVGKYLYYFDLKTGKKLTKTLKTIGNDTYYFQSNGTAAKKKWLTVKGKRHYFQSNGKMAKATWVGKYYVDANGVKTGQTKKTGWSTVNGNKYYFDKNANMAKGWQTISGKKYYFNSSGIMLTGIQMIGSTKHYFYPEGDLAYSTSIIIGAKQYTINSQGVVTGEKAIQVSGNTKGAQIAKYALQFVGNKYVYGGVSPEKGSDCSGFLYTIYSRFGIRIPRVADPQMKGPETGYKAAAVDIGSIQPGDLIFYGSGNYASHVGMYIGNGNIVHASNSQPYPRGGVKISNYNYQKPLRAVRYWS